MLRTARQVKGYTLGARDGEIGRAKDFYFDDQNWAVRYLVADTNKWLPGRQVLLSPFALRGFRDTEKLLNVDLTRDQIKASPSIDEDMPITRQYEVHYHQYYNWPFYWQGGGLWGPDAYPLAPVTMPAPETTATPKPTGDPHLQSTEATTGYRIHAHDGDIGHLEDFLIDDQEWRIRYLEINTGHWWAGRKILVSPEWISAIDWQQSSVRVDLDRETIKGAPEYEPGKPVDREYEARLHEYYQRAPYWNQRLAA